MEAKKCDECNVELALCVGWITFNMDEEPFDSGKNVNEDDFNISKETQLCTYICPNCNKIKSEINEC